MTTHLAFTLLLAVLLCLLGLMRRAVPLVAMYLLCAGCLIFEARHGSLVFPSPLLLSIGYRFVPLAMTTLLVLNLPSGKLTASLRRLPIPSKVTLVLVTMLRFAPTVISESRDIKEAMRVRGLLRSPLSSLIHPLDTAEYAIVPLVLRSLRVSDELSASAIVRGIEFPCKKQSYYSDGMSRLDWTLIIVFVLASLSCCLIV